MSWLHVAGDADSESDEGAAAGIRQNRTLLLIAAVGNHPVADNGGQPRVQVVAVSDGRRNSYIKRFSPHGLE